MLCRYCGQQNDNESRFCAACGKTLDIPGAPNPMGTIPPPPPPPPSPPRTTSPTDLEQPLTIAMFVMIVPCAIKALVKIPLLFESIGLIFDGDFLLGLFSFLINILTILSCLILGGVLFLSAKCNDKSKSQVLFWGVAVAAVLRVAVSFIQIFLYIVACVLVSYGRYFMLFAPAMIIPAIIFSVAVVVVAYFKFINLPGNTFSLNFTKDILIDNTKNSIELLKTELDRLIKKTN